ncbi:proline--tRNA ligase [bacterium]|jgi:prolyl-tRNA synthetase|nr:proline--tRNA ligase [bacterium]MBT3903829.1 proline--tRNA ligase [bacterium]MBT4577450.1 proline--tRNA ligase [bacterium]MBT5345965.1 proline--tRNA ligase [bacterium]MBT6130751.1 proline--tRNA ligase [bacterium]
MKNKLPNITTDFSSWYNDVVYRSDLADTAPVRGCIVIRPYGCQIWESIKTILDKKIKDTDHENIMLPLLIPESFLRKEAEHIEGFAPELAVVTHAGGKKLEESLVIRPTSETMMYHMFSRWIKSWRDLPLKLNQWCSVVRWEKRPRPFLRTSEFFWQEGHTAHATEQEAHDEALLMLDQYIDLIQNYLAIPVIKGEKPESEKFAGAKNTYTMEAIMPDGKALQMGTSHHIQQSFGKAFDIAYQDKDGKLATPHFTSWGATTRLIGALIMTHGDQKGLILPPKVAPIQVVIIPIIKANQDNQAVLEEAQKIYSELKQSGIRVKLDLDATQTPGAKFYNWELKGVPVRIELGARDLESQSVTIANRLTCKKESIALTEISHMISKTLDDTQQALFQRAEARNQELTKRGNKLAEWGPILNKENGAYIVGWCQSDACEDKLKSCKATIRCLIATNESPECFACTKKSLGDIVVAKAY